eukprot:15315801-Ditylum_brightwellii.AAC.1
MASNTTNHPPPPPASSNTTLSSCAKKQRAPTWKDGSPKHMEFIALCEQKQWDSMPVMGGDTDLNAFRKGGLNRNREVQFNKNQLVLKEFKIACCSGI